VWLKFLHDEIGDGRPQSIGGGVEDVLADIPPDQAQSILVLGTDERFGDKKAGLPIRSDTMMVVHLDPDRKSTAVMSLPRDLVVNIPGHGRGAINGAYDLEHNGGGSHRAYRIVLSHGDSGQYYGVQGTTWREPPILKGPSTKREMRGRTYSVYRDDGRIKLVAWRTKRGVYWVSNTLSSRLSDAQMLAVARSLARVGQ
jgi:hypothetical protein